MALYFCIEIHETQLIYNLMFDYQFPTWLPIAFFVVLIISSFIVGTWLNKNDRGYKGIFKK